MYLPTTPTLALRFSDSADTDGWVLREGFADYVCSLDPIMPDGCATNDIPLAKRRAGQSHETRPDWIAYTYLMASVDAPYLRTFVG